MKAKALADINSGKGIIKEGDTFEGSKKWIDKLIDIGKAKKLPGIKQDKSPKTTKEEKTVPDNKWN